MSKYIWRDCKKQPPLVDDGELVLMDSKDKFWVGFCKITPDGVFYFASNTDPLKNDFVKYARIEKLLAAESELERTYKALDVAVDALKRAHNTYCVEEEDITIDLTESAAHKWQRTAYQMEMPISIALEQITALEQKDK